MTSYTDPLYEEALEAVRAAPEAVIEQRRLTQIAALKLRLPEMIRSRRTLRRKTFATFESALREKERREVEIRFTVKSARDTQNKLVYPNRESREAEVEQRLLSDSAWASWDRQRSSAYAEYKSLDDEVDYYERLDQSLLEIIAMLTAAIDFETRFSKKVEPHARSSTRARQRAKLAHRVGEQAQIPPC